ncbi:MAG TPA: hypothetical protein VEA35_12650 [Ramlibacter sp.]|nr:hypothetical protein [Ramlibacter sp.]
MPSMFQQALAAAHRLPVAAQAITSSVPEDDDVALGCECAYPALQLEAWEPQRPVLPAAALLLSSKS